jgi:hypothetical protein
MGFLLLRTKIERSRTHLVTTPAELLDAQPKDGRLGSSLKYPQTDQCQAQMPLYTILNCLTIHPFTIIFYVRR